MKLEVNSAMKARQHNVYKNKDDKRVPGVTTITGVLNKPALVGWANQLGLDGIKVKEYVDDLAQIGTLAHYMIECHILSKIEGKEIKPDVGDYSPNQITSATVSFSKYLQWEKKNNVEYLHSEIWLTSEKYQFGGCLDILALVNGVKTLVDIKTCKAIYKDHHLQISAYSMLAEENNMAVQECRIIRVGRDDSEGLEAEDVLVPHLNKYRQMFHRCLEIYNLKKELKW